MNAWHIAAIVAIVVVGVGTLIVLDFRGLRKKNPKPTIVLPPKVEVNRDPAAALRAGKVLGLQMVRERIKYHLEGGEIDRSARRELQGVDNWIRQIILKMRTEAGR